MSQTIRVIARLLAKPEYIEQLKIVLLGVIEPTRREPGCIQYEIYQNQDDPTDFTFIEEWQSVEALNQHLASNHIQKATNDVLKLTNSPPDIRVYRIIA